MRALESQFKKLESQPSTATNFSMDHRDVVAEGRMSRLLQHLNPQLPDKRRTASLSNIGLESCQGAIEKEGELAAGDKIEYSEAKPRERPHVILVIGAGDATGGAVAKKFAKENYVACLVRRNVSKLDAIVQQILQEGGKAYGFGVDARKEDQVVALVEQIERDVGEIKVLVFNIGANVNFSILEMTSRVYQKVWEMACFSGFLAGREVAKHMVGRKNGTIIFTGATASIRGGSGYAAFSGAKFGLRALAQSMARELGPKGIHVAHVIIDSPIDTPWVRGMIANPSSLIERGGMVSPQDIGDIYWQIHQQPRTAWTHEMDVRPWIETW